MSTAPRVLIVSTRRVSNLLGSGPIYEFEHAIAGLEGADVIEIDDHDGSWYMKLAQRVNTAVRLATRGRIGHRGPIPWPADGRVERDYELTLLMTDTVFNMRYLNLVRHARERSRRVLMYVPEVWPEVFESARLGRQNFSLVDHFFIGTVSSVERLANVSGRGVTALPASVSTLRFLPTLRWRERPVDLAWPGRRLEPMHTDLMRLTGKPGWLYYYDGFSGAWAEDPIVQRDWLAGLMMRTRFAIGHHARAGQPELHRGNLQVPGRFFEGAAAGAVLVGSPPDSTDWQSCGAWPDAIIPMALEHPGADRLLLDLAADIPRMEAASRRNVIESLRRNDCAHRWAKMLDTVGAERGHALERHLALLEERAQALERFDLEPSGSTQPLPTPVETGLPSDASGRPNAAPERLNLSA